MGQGPGCVSDYKKVAEKFTPMAEIGHLCSEPAEGFGPKSYEKQRDLEGI